VPTTPPTSANAAAARASDAPHTGSRRSPPPRVSRSGARTRRATNTLSPISTTTRAPSCSATRRTPPSAGCVVSAVRVPSCSTNPSQRSSATSAAPPSASTSNSVQPLPSARRSPSTTKSERQPDSTVAHSGATHGSSAASGRGANPMSMPRNDQRSPVSTPIFTAPCPAGKVRADSNVSPHSWWTSSVRPAAGTAGSESTKDRPSSEGTWVSSSWSIVDLAFGDAVTDTAPARGFVNSSSAARQGFVRPSRRRADSRIPRASAS
jgi:hypothetical protein